MKTSEILIALSLSAGTFFPQLSHAAGDVVEGQKKTSMCAGCHGIEGMRTAYPEVFTVPKLGGQNAAYIVNALSAYRSGARKFATMRAIASSLSDQDIADLAAYYSTVQVAK